MLDQALTRLAAGPDQQSLALLYERLAPAIRRLAARLTGDSQVGEDCVAETLLAASRAAGDWRQRSADPDQDARRWVLGIAATTALSMARSRRRARARDARAAATAVVDSPIAPESAVIDGERAAIVQEALAQLPRPYGEAIAARYVDGLDVQQAAARLGVPPATVKTRVFRGLSLMRRRLDGLRAALSLALWPSLASRHGAVAAGVGAHGLRLAVVVGSFGIAAAVPTIGAPTSAVVPTASAPAAAVTRTDAKVAAHPRRRTVIAACKIIADASDGPVHCTATSSTRLDDPE
jgi:RNA polymerase sigma-70 factor (ECF subfamily)